MGTRPELILRAAVAILALANGVLHLMLDVVLFRGNFFGPVAPPGAAPPPQPFPLPLNQLFVVEFVGYVLLVVLFWFSRRWLGRLGWLVDLALLAYTGASIAGWLSIGGPNPRGLGYLAKGIEIALILAVLAHLVTWRRTGTRVVPASDG